ncbi:MAG: pyruvate:ferredoxin (flavodoxin) oxidoreductase [Bacilli bacterium]|nr:pyruvate:ferredoxin (flavodoxin) oxidoreductase [Bacilli bacterium]
MNEYKTMDANEAVASVAYKFSEVCGIYPITPASPMAEHVDAMASRGELNYFGNKVKVIEMQSEAGAVAMVHGSLQSGVLSTTFTASQGLLLMIPTLYKMAGEMLPGVIHVAARSLSTHALSIFGDHQDVYAVSGTGACMLASSSPEEAYHMAAIAHLSSIKSSIPFINFFDGFRTSHEIDKIKLMDLDKIKKLIDEKALDNFRARAMSNTTPNTRGTAQNDDVYFQNTEARNKDYMNVTKIIENYMTDINKITGSNIKPFNYYGSKSAKYVIIAMGSVCNTIRETIDYLNKDNNVYGLVEVHLFRPFNNKLLQDIIPKSVEVISVLDRSKDFTADSEKLYLDVVNATKDTNIEILGGRYGLSSKNTNPAQIKAVYDNMINNKKNHFTIGIIDDVTNLSLDIDNEFKLPTIGEEFLIYGYGSDGMVSTSKDLIKIIGDHTNKYVQGYFQYDSKKSGGVTRSHIRINNKKIYSSYYVENPRLVVVSKDNYIYKYDILDNIQDNGVLLLNTNLTNEQLSKSLPNKIKYLMAKKNIKVYIIDAYKLVNELGLKNKISTCMEICIFKLLNVIDINKVKNIMKESNKKRFINKGKEIIEVNNKVVDNSIDKLRKFNIDKDWINLNYDEKKDETIYQTIGNLKGDTLPVSAFIDKKNGIYDGGTTKYEKRGIAEMVPCWNKENCIQCNQCSFVCPHAVVRPFLLDKDNNKVDSIPSIMPKDYNYTIGVSYEDCTGCGLCANTCPGKLGKKALEMKPYDKERFKEDNFLYLLEHNKNKDYKAPILNVKNESFIEPKFEFSGSCAGCGETAYLKNLTQVFNDNLVIANATGCSSIYGASIPSTPYSIPWANSLFEDNAEFGLGILTGINLKREKIKTYMENNISKDKELFTKWLNNIDNHDICLEVSKQINYNKHKYLYDLKDYIVPKSMWIVGGDGFAYDIGYGGIDHILSRNENINILVLDTEVYSNTGGQSSKSSNLGSIASFTSSGKSNYKKDLARIAMCYPHVYVACVNIGYDKEQYLKVLKEASLHNGPSIVIAYCPCIEHGIKTGMEHSLDNARLAGVCGYALTFRYNPDDNKFIMDSKNIDFSKYHDFLMTENRYANLFRVNKENADKILENQREWAIKRYDYYKKLEDNK